MDFLNIEVAELQLLVLQQVPEVTHKFVYIVATSLLNWNGVTVPAAAATVTKTCAAAVVWGTPVPPASTQDGKHPLSPDTTCLPVGLVPGIAYCATPCVVNVYVPVAFF